MVKGITRQVVVVKGGDPAMFEQAIFLVKDGVLSQGGVSEEALLTQARQACARERTPWQRWREKLTWAACGAALPASCGLSSASCDHIWPEKINTPLLGMQALRSKQWGFSLIPEKRPPPLSPPPAFPGGRWDRQCGRVW